MANRNPIQTAEFKARIRRPQEGNLGVKLAGKTYGVKLPPDIALLVDQIPQRSAWLRRVITEAARRELLRQEEVLVLLDKLEQTNLTPDQREMVAAIRQHLTDVTIRPITSSNR